MQTWAKRGIQTALVTGGLLMLGTGIASADENVDPDRPAGPLDGSISVPIHADNNAIGTPVGQVDLPGVDHEVKVAPSEATDKLPEPVKGAVDEVKGTVNDAAAKGAEAAGSTAGQLDPAASPAGDATSQASEHLSQASPEAGEAVSQVGEKVSNVPGHAPGAHTNQLSADLVAPIEISGNAIALGGPAAVDNSATQSASADSSASTDGSGTVLGGNQANLAWALPAQITGNAIGLGGEATSTNNVQQSADATGDVTADGTEGTLAGNVLAGHLATPVQITGNALAGGPHGSASTDSQANSDATAGGAISTLGEGGLLAGTVGAVPAALPVELNGNALSGLGGEAEANSESSADATAGGTAPNFADVPSYIQTSGNDGTLSGTVGHLAPSTPVAVAGNAGSLIGESEAEGSTENMTTAGAFNSTSGVGGLGSGTMLNGPVAMPVEAISNAATVGGEAEALHDNTVDALAGGRTFTNGDESALSGTSAAAPIAGPADLLGNAVAVLGESSTSGDSTGMHNEATAQAGGYTGTLGNDSLGGGNAATVPVALPIEGFADAVGAAGVADAAATENKVSGAGGDTSTVDDNAVLASNAVNMPVAGPVQAFGDALGVLASSTAYGEATNEVTAGGPTHASGVGSFGSGNIAQAPVQLPAQLFGLGGSALSEVSATGVNDTIGTSGGGADTDGTEGTISGNVVSAPAGALAQAFGDSVTVLGLGSATGDHLGDHVTGGDVQTAGDEGSISGNVLSPQLMPALQLFGDAVDVAGMGSAEGTNDVINTVGGDVQSSGDASSLSGNLFDVPVAAIGQGFGDAISVLGNAAASGDNVAEHTVGGQATSDGGFAGQLPLGGIAQFYDIPLPIMANALTMASNDSTTTVADQEPQLNLNVTGSEMPVNAVPELPAFPAELPQPGGMAGHTLPAPVHHTLPAPTSVQPKADSAITSMDHDRFGLKRLVAELQGKNMHIQ